MRWPRWERCPYLWLSFPTRMKFAVEHSAVYYKDLTTQRRTYKGPAKHTATYRQEKAQTSVERHRRPRRCAPHCWVPSESIHLTCTPNTEPQL